MQRESVSSYAIIQSVLYEDVAVGCFIVILQSIYSYDRDAIDLCNELASQYINYGIPSDQ